MLFRSHGNGPCWPLYYPIGPKRSEAIKVFLKRTKLKHKPVSVSYANQLVLRAAIGFELTGQVAVRISGSSSNALCRSPRSG